MNSKGVEGEIKKSGNELTEGLLLDNLENKDNATPHAKKALAWTVASMLSAATMVASAFFLKMVLEAHAHTQKHNRSDAGFVPGFIGVVSGLLFGFIGMTCSTWYAHKHVSRVHADMYKALLRVLLALEFLGFASAGVPFLKNFVQLVHVSYEEMAAYIQCRQNSKPHQNPAASCPSPESNYSKSYITGAVFTALAMFLSAVYAGYSLSKAYKDAKSPTLKASLAATIALTSTGFAVGAGFFIQYMSALINECGDHCHYENYSDWYIASAVGAGVFVLLPAAGAAYKFSGNAYRFAKMAYKQTFFSAPGLNESDDPSDMVLDVFPLPKPEDDESSSTKSNRCCCIS